MRTGGIRGRGDAHISCGCAHMNDSGGLRRRRGVHDGAHSRGGGSATRA